MVVGAMKPIRVHVPISLEGATDCKIIWRNKRTHGIWDGVAEETEDGWCVTYVPQLSTEISYPGTWKVQVQVTKDGNPFKSKVGKFWIDGAL